MKIGEDYIEVTGGTPEDQIAAVDQFKKVRKKYYKNIEQHKLGIWRQRENLLLSIGVLERKLKALNES